MNFLEIASKLISSINVAANVITEATKAMKAAKQALKMNAADASYSNENLFLELLLDIGDPRGGSAVIRRRLRQQATTWNSLANSYSLNRQSWVDSPK